jgi:flagellar L-ring protein precursor FlgH
MKSSRASRSRWIGRIGLTAWWLVAAIGLSQTSSTQNVPNALPGGNQGVQPPPVVPPAPAVQPASRVPAATATQPPVSTAPRVGATAVSRSTSRGLTTRTGVSVPAQAQVSIKPDQTSASTPAPAPDPPPPYPVAARVLPPPTEATPVLLPLTPLATVAPAGKGTKKNMLQKLVPANPNIAATSLNSYVERLHRETSAVQPLPGSIWTESGRLTRLNTDVRAMRPNDLIQVVVLENLAASTDGTVKNQRASTANSSISGLLGSLHANNALQNLITQSSANTLNAAGASATTSSLSTTFGGQVIEVLPNGMLVIEAARQVEFAQQTQTIILRGLVRPEDISQENQVISTAISSLELEVKGKGIVNDYTRRQNALVRLLQQILVF